MYCYGAILMLACIIPLFLTCARIIEPGIEPRREKPDLRGFRPGLAQTQLYRHRRCLETRNFELRKWRNNTIRVAKTKNKGAGQLRSCCEVDLRLCFRLGKTPVFSRIGTSSNTNKQCRNSFTGSDTPAIVILLASIGNV